MNRAPRTMGRELSIAFGWLAAFIVLLLAANVVPRTWLLNEINPEVQGSRHLQQVLASVHIGMLEEQSRLRAYVATGEPDFLASSRAAAARVAGSMSRLVATIPAGPLSEQLAALRRAQDRWTRMWVRPAVAGDIGSRGRSTPRRQGGLARFLERGHALFDRYRSAHDQLAADLDDRLTSAARAERTWLVWSGVGQAVLALVVLAVSLLFRRRAERRVTRPAARLAATVRAIRGGDLEVRTHLGSAPAELTALADDVDEMRATLAEKSRLADLRRRETEIYVGRLDTVLSVAREIAGSLSLRYVLASVTRAAQHMSGAGRVRVWLVEEAEHSLSLSFDTAAAAEVDEVGASSNTDLIPAIVERSAAAGRLISTGTSLAVPMIVGARVVGVVECDPAAPTDDGVLGILETLAGHAAGAVESARLHERTRELSVTDALTGLANRRAFDDEFDVEAARALRHRRPLAVVYADIDRFKALNDVYGHSYGDVALQRAAAAIATALRETDRAYRLGGEEVVVLAPETTAEEAAALAERLRRAVEQSSGSDGAPCVTASFGVAELLEHAADPAALLVAADRALYEAKTSGRNRVCTFAPSAA